MDPQEIGKLVAQTVEKVVNMKLAGMRLNSEGVSTPSRAKGDEALRELVIREVATLRAELLGAIGQVAQQQHSALVFGLDQLGHRIESWLGHEPAVAPVEAEATGEEPADGPEGASAVEDSSS